MIMENNEQEFKFSVEQVLTLKNFSYIEKDALKAILNKDNKYSLEEVNYLLEQFKKGDVR